MPDNSVSQIAMQHCATDLPAHTARRVPVIALGISLSIFLAVTFTLCVGFDLLFPGQAMYETWRPLLPGFIWLSWPSFFLGLAETFAYGWYIAVFFGPLYNFLAARSGEAGRA